MSDNIKAKRIIIVESPTKAKTIKSYFNQYDVFATKGHFRNLKKPKGVVYNDDKSIDLFWTIDHKKIQGILKNVNNGDQVFIATDNDREGAGIAYHITELLKQNNLQVHISRLRFSEITKKALEEALSNPEKLNTGLINAYLARLALDFRYGFEASPLLWKCIAPRLSFGRVQNPTLNLLFERYLERKNFISITTYSLELTIAINDNKVIVAKYCKDNLNREQLNIITQELEKKILLTSKTMKKMKLSPKSPFITSTLQQTASSAMNKPIKTIMQIAQQLYEGVTIQGENRALITYMRTDSNQISSDGLENIRNYISQNFDPEYMPDKPNVYVNKSKNAQEAHECIRPIDIFITPKSVEEYLNKDQLELYRIIWLRTLQCQMTPAIKQIERYCFHHKEHKFYYSQSYLIFPGYLMNFDYRPKIIDNNKYYAIIKHNILEHNSKPPANYTESSLVKTLEQLGIGRPSTFSNIIDKIKTRKYGLFMNKCIRISQLGIIVCLFNSIFFKEFSDYNFTSAMEHSLDLISQSQINKQKFLVQQFDQLSSTIKDIDNYVQSNQISYKGILKKITELWHKYDIQACYKCNKPIELRSKFSVFMFCGYCNINIPIDTVTTVYPDGSVVYYMQPQYKKIIYKDKTVNISCKIINYSDDFLWQNKTQLLETIDNIKSLYQEYRQNQNNTIEK